MGLVDYSDSESENDAPQAPAPAKVAPSTKKPFQKLVDKTNPGKILINLPSASATDDATPSDEPAAKRVKTGGSKFGGFGSLLPPPKAVTKPAGMNKVAPKVGINLKTSSEAAFSRDDTSIGEYGDSSENGSTSANGAGGSGLSLPPPKAMAAQPSIPEGQKSADEVKLVGKPMIFKPLSVSRKPAKKNGTKALVAPKTAAPSSATAQTVGAPPVAPPPKKQVSLFSFEAEEAPSQAASEGYTEYEPEFTKYDNSAYAEAQEQYANYTQPAVSAYADPNSLDSIADDMNLDPAARRELFGRGGAGSNEATAKSVINFNLDREYQHNEELRASGALDQQKHNALRAIKPGKHSLQQLVNQVQSQKDALEENFAKNRSTQKQASSRYGWR